MSVGSLFLAVYILVPQFIYTPFGGWANRSRIEHKLPYKFKCFSKEGEGVFAKKRYVLKDKF